MIEDTVVYSQQTSHHSPWTVRQRIKMLAWEYVWLILCSWTPKPLNFWRIFWLKVFGAKMVGKPFVHQRARIQIPWNLYMYNKSCLGDRANAYSLGKIVIKEYAVIAQEAYICTGTHAFELSSSNLITKTIIIEKRAFVGARVFILPGVTIGEGSVIGAGSLVTKDIPSWKICAGSPCKVLKDRTMVD